MDGAYVATELQGLLKLRSVPFCMKIFEKVEDMEAVPRIGRPEHVHTLDHLVGQTSRLSWTIGVTADNLVGAPCRALVGLIRPTSRCSMPHPAP